MIAFLSEDQFEGEGQADGQVVDENVNSAGPVISDEAAAKFDKSKHDN